MIRCRVELMQTRQIGGWERAGLVRVRNNGSRTKCQLVFPFVNFLFYTIGVVKVMMMMMMMMMVMMKRKKKVNLT